MANKNVASVLIPAQQTATVATVNPCSSKLCSLQKGEKALISSVNLENSASQRLMEMGFVPGLEVSVAGTAPGGDPIVYSVAGSQVAIRRETAAFISITSLPLV